MRVCESPNLAMSFPMTMTERRLTALRQIDCRQMTRPIKRRKKTARSKPGGFISVQ